MKVINIFGGPGVGKTAQATEIFSYLKKHDYNVEYVSEYAKMLTWREAFRVLGEQNYVFSKQLHNLRMIKDKVDIAVTDSPLLLSIVYNNINKKNNNFYEDFLYFDDYVLHEFDKFENYNFYLKRQTNYQITGRNQTKDEALSIDHEVLNVLDNNNIEYNPVNIDDLFSETMKKMDVYD